MNNAELIKDILCNEYKSAICENTTEKLKLACKYTMEQFKGTYLIPSIDISNNKGVVKIVSFNKDTIGKIILDL